MRMLRSLPALAAAVTLALLAADRHRPGADQDHDRQGDQRQRLPYPELRRDGPGLLQGGRPRRQLRLADRQGAGDRRRSAGSVDFVPIPSGGAQAALSGAEIRYVVGESLKSQWLIVGAPEHRQAAGPQGQDRRLRPCRLRRLRRRRRRAAARLQDGGRQGLQGDLVPGRDRADRRPGQRRHRGGADLGPARAQGAQCRHEDTAADRRPHSARGRHVLDTQGLCRPEPRDRHEVHPRHRQGRDVLPRQQGGLAQRPSRSISASRRQGRRPHLGPDCTTRSAPSFPRTCSARSSNCAGST